MVTAADIQAGLERNEFFLESVKLTADASWSKAKRDEINLENNTQLVPAKQLDTLTIDYGNNPFPQLTPGRDYSDPTKLYLRNTIYGSGYGKTPRVEDDSRVRAWALPCRRRPA